MNHQASDSLSAATNSLQDPWTWLQIIIVILATIAMYQIGRLLLNKIKNYMTNFLLRGLHIAWFFLTLASGTIVASYIAGLKSLGIIYEIGQVIVENFGSSFGQVIWYLTIAIILWKLVSSISHQIIPNGLEFNRINVRTKTLKNVIEGTLKIIIALGTIIVVLQSLGLNATSLLAGVSVLGIAVGFGAQSLVKDIFTGFFILLEDQYGVGDFIQINESKMSGTVENLNLRLTVVRDLDGTVHIVPNGQITTVSVSSKDWSQVVATIGISYQANIDHSLEVFSQTCRDLYNDSHWQGQFLEEPSVQGITKLGADSVTLRALFKVIPKSQWEIEREFNLRIKKALDQAEIEIPFPQRTISFDNKPIEVNITDKQVTN